MEWGVSFFLRIIKKMEGGKANLIKKRLHKHKPLSFNLICRSIPADLQGERSWLVLLKITASNRFQDSLFSHLNGVAEKHTNKKGMLLKCEE